MSDGLVTAAPNEPLGAKAKVSIVFETFSVTTTWAPLGLIATSSGLLAPGLRGCEPPGMAVRPRWPAQKPVTLAAPPPMLSTSTALPWMATLVGVVPPLTTVSINCRAPLGPTAKSETWLDPASTASRLWRSADSVSDPCENPPAPVPRPPVA